MQNVLDTILAKTAWPMDIIQPYSETHMLITLLVLGTALILAKYLALSKIPTAKLMAIIGVLLALMEIYKEMFLAYTEGSYVWSDFPFQLCSIPIYLCLFYSFFSARGKYVTRQFYITFSLIGAVGAFIEPTSSFNEYWVLTIHSISWHGILVMLCIVLLIRDYKEYQDGQKLYTQKQVSKKFVPVLKRYFLLSLVAISFNAIFQTTSQGDMNMFFIGPNQPRLILLDDIYANCGWIVETVFMITATMLSAWIVYQLEYFCYSKINNNKAKKVMESIKNSYSR